MQLALAYGRIRSDSEYPSLIAKGLCVLPVEVKQYNACRLEACLVRNCSQQICNGIRLSGAGAPNDSRVASNKPIHIQVRTDRLGAGNASYGDVAIIVPWCIHRLQIRLSDYVNRVSDRGVLGYPSLELCSPSSLTNKFNSEPPITELRSKLGRPGCSSGADLRYHSIQIDIS